MNSAGGNFSFAAGTQATIPVSAPGSFLWSDSQGPATLPANAHDQFVVASTNGIEASDATYLSTEQKIQSLTSQRDALVQQMKDVLDGTTNGHAEQLIHDGQSLLQQAAALAS